MNKQEVDNYFEAIEYFDWRFNPSSRDTEELTLILNELYKSWPNTSLLLADQGFFVSMLQLN
ncbi:MAG: hypothetical protein EBY39_02805 [Flavobacteriia bacterium]|jgi:hypothetical protein|nr:hypothetical protein [Rhodobacterales bacterium]NDG51943.1 hypothetical protein [Flavobacteriia bacterium]